MSSSRPGKARQVAKKDVRSRAAGHAAPCSLQRERRFVLLVPLSSSRFYRQAGEAFVHRVHDSGCLSEVIDTARGDALAVVSTLDTTSLAGFAGSAEALDVLASLRGVSSLPRVLLGEEVFDPELDRVSIDHEAIAYRLTAMLCEKKHNVVALVAGGPVASLADGFNRALSEHGYPRSPRPVILLDQGRDEDELDLVLAMAMAERQRPTGFLCADGSMAAAVDRQLNALGFVSGEHIDLAAIDDDGVSEERGVSMFRLARPGYSFGAEAARLLLRRSATPKAPPEVVTLASGPVITGITGATIEPPRRRGGSHL